MAVRFFVVGAQCPYRSMRFLNASLPPSRRVSIWSLTLIDVAGGSDGRVLAVRIHDEDAVGFAQHRDVRVVGDEDELPLPPSPFGCS